MKKIKRSTITKKNEGREAGKTEREGKVRGKEKLKRNEGEGKERREKKRSKMRRRIAK